MKTTFYLLVLLLLGAFAMPKKPNHVRAIKPKEVAKEYTYQKIDVSKEIEEIEKVAQNIEKNNTYLRYKKKQNKKNESFFKTNCKRFAYIYGGSGKFSGQLVFKGNVCKFMKTKYYKTSEEFIFEIYTLNPETHPNQSQYIGKYNIKL